MAPKLFFSVLCSAYVLSAGLVGVGVKADELKSPNATSKPVVLRDVPYGAADGVTLLMHIVLPTPKPVTPVPAILFIHGGGWQSGTRNDGLDRAIQCAADGYVGVSVEYRLTQKAPFPAQIQDCKCAVRFLRANAKQYGINPARIGAWGSSAGGHLAGMLGLTGGIAEFEGDAGWRDATSDVQAVCDWYGPTDLASWVRLEQRFGNDSDLRTLFCFRLKLRTE